MKASAPKNNTNEQEPDSGAPLRANWYDQSEEYWRKVEATVNGMLGGLGHVSEVVCSAPTESMISIRACSLCRM